ncbi:AsnC family protein [Actinoplanes sp. ATCC 53533]|uniref:Lrp/AsnC family transcriptional regulator n=1 Tax=Actinoplanes sp. ATCC 53533 TaxID=1288362 RepID=UPI000F79B1B2|nr:AsnC family protein [Actinoplanes sp. ATCC 53533]RSM61899.1 AsnC family protein [Actinoplanes sp. ATCC 53533]
MVARSAVESAVLDRLDRQILQGLRLAPRVPFARLAAVLGVSEQTVARRYQRMRTGGLLRVFGQANPERLPDTTFWALRIYCRPGTATTTAQALARRTDTSWVTIGAGGVELSCAVQVAQDRDGRDGGLLHHLPRAANVLSLSAHQVLHRFVGRGETDWIAGDDQLGADQRELLLDGADPGVRASADQRPGAGDDARVEPGDRALLAALAADGRAGYAALATATGWTQRKVALRLSALIAAGAVYFDTEVAATLMGFRAAANLWLTVAPADLAVVGARIADHRQLVWAAAVTGIATIAATALCRDAEELYRYLTTEVAAIPEIRTCETVPVRNRVKHAVSLVDGGVLGGPVI